jgi:hypothetical protein
MARQQEEPEARRARMAQLRELAKAAQGRQGRTSGKTSVTLTASELDHLARLITAGYAVLRDTRSISPNLRKAMKRMNVSTQGL